MDSHVYVCRRRVLDVLQDKAGIDSIREEFIPWLCKPQYQRTKQEKYGRGRVPTSSVLFIWLTRRLSVLNPVTNALKQELALKHSTLHSKASVHLARNEEFLHSPPSDDQNQEHNRALVPDEDEDEVRIPASLRIGLVTHRAEGGYTSRANNLHAYLDLNGHVCETYHVFIPLLTDETRTTVPFPALLLAPHRPGEPGQDRPEGTNIFRLYRGPLHAGRGADNYQEVRCRQPLRHRKDGEDCGVRYPGPLCHRRWVSDVPMLPAKVRTAFCTLERKSMGAYWARARRLARKLNCPNVLPSAGMKSVLVVSFLIPISCPRLAQSQSRLRAKRETRRLRLDCSADQRR